MDFDGFNLVLPIAAWHRNVALGNAAIERWRIEMLASGERIIHFPRH